ncbi:hypothetical protein BH09SUM1_BH09SUM1_10190 [soil metagenome]
MSLPYKTWHESEVERFRRRPDEIPMYLEISFEEAKNDGEWGAFLMGMLALSEAVDAGQGIIARVKTLKAEFDKTRIPDFHSLEEILHELGFALSFSIKPLGETA